MDKKKTWVRPWIKNRQKYGSFHTLHKELELDQQAFKEYFRLDKTQFEVLLQKVYRFHRKEGIALHCLFYFAWLINELLHENCCNTWATMRFYFRAHATLKKCCMESNRFDFAQHFFLIIFVASHRKITLGHDAIFPCACNATICIACA